MWHFPNYLPARVLDIHWAPPIRDIRERFRRLEKRRGSLLAAVFSVLFCFGGGECY